MLYSNDSYAGLMACERARLGDYDDYYDEEEYSQYDNFDCWEDWE